MSGEKVFNRWFVVAGALIIQVSLGAVYIWSVFQTPLMSVYPSWSETAVTLPAQLVLASFALAVIFGGRFQDRLGPRKVATAGGIILGVGLILARFTQYFSPPMALIWLIITFSILGGIGIGAGYVCPIATCVKWFPDKRGLISGLAVAGFGAGAFFFAPLARGLVSGGAYQVFAVDLFTLPRLGVFNTFMALGIIFLVAVVAGAQLLRNPPEGYSPPGWSPPKQADGSSLKSADFTPSQMLRTPAFWFLWITYFAGCTAGLQVIMKASPIWQSMGIADIVPPVPEAEFLRIGALGAMAVSILALFNSGGRIIWGKISDTIGRKTTLVVMFILCGTVMLMLNSMQSFPLFLLGIGVVGLCFGGFLAIYPALTADYFGTKHLGVNYGWMYTAYGAGGIVGPFLAAKLMRVESNIPYLVSNNIGEIAEKMFAVGNYQAAFVVAGIACIIAAAVALMIKVPVQNNAG
ncbi:major facilitator superfamily transporter [Chitinispirillum alkaliphilum]|nr:major facilitator superfamily transporter [Chitinispirillum alkaliphilum]